MTDPKDQLVYELGLLEDQVDDLKAQLAARTREIARLRAQLNTALAHLHIAVDCLRTVTDD